MKTAVVLLGLIALASATKWFELNKDYTFESYKTEFGKSYSHLREERIRRGIFEKNLEKIMSHNQNPASTWKAGVNHMTDWSHEEFSKLLGYKMGADNHLEKPRAEEIEVDLDALPKTVDWRTKGVISAVKDQGVCGSCWTFGTVEVIESHWAIKSGDLQVLSEQQILDCIPNPDQCGGTGGCGGGTPELAMAGLIQLGGLTSEWTYPYISYDTTANPSCEFGTGFRKAFVKLANYTVLTSNSYAAVMDAVARVGPLAINVDASAWSSYESGVFNNCSTSPDIDHVVQLVGYGTDDKFGPYWLVRNSWNPTWGEEGYIRLVRETETQQCGWDKKPSDGTGCRGGPSEQYVCGQCGLLFDVSYPMF